MKILQGIPSISEICFLDFLMNIDVFINVMVPCFFLDILRKFFRYIFFYSFFWKLYGNSQFLAQYFGKFFQYIYCLGTALQFSELSLANLWKIGGIILKNPLEIYIGTFFRYSCGNFLSNSSHFLWSISSISLGISYKKNLERSQMTSNICGKG